MFKSCTLEQMSQISKYPISKKVYDKIFDVFIKATTGLYSKQTSTMFFKEFLTPTEQVMLSKRLAIAFLLSKNYQHREISKILRVSTTTINRVSITLHNGTNFSNVVLKILQKEKMEDFWLSVGQVISKVLSGGRSKSGSWRYLRSEIQKKKTDKQY